MPDGVSEQNQALVVSPDGYLNMTRWCSGGYDDPKGDEFDSRFELLFLLWQYLELI